MNKEGHFFLYGKLPKHIRSFLDFYRGGFIGLIDFLKLSQIAKEVYTSLGDESRLFDVAYREISDNWFDVAQVISILARTTWTVKVTSDPYYALCRAWILGERLGKKELRFLGITKNIDNDQDAVRAMQVLLRLLTLKTQSQSARDTVILALDDCQFFVELKDSDRKTIQQGLRDVFDGFPEGLCLLMSFTAGDAKKLKSFLIEDLQSRMKKDPIQISELSQSEAVDFITDLINSNKFKKEDAPDKFYPYTEESISKAVDIVETVDQLTPRNLMSQFDGLTSAAQRELFPKRIDIKFVKKYFGRR